MRPCGGGGIGRGPCATDGVESAALGRTGLGCRGLLGPVLACGALTEGCPVCWGEVQSSAEISIFLLQLCDALLEGLQRYERNMINHGRFEINNGKGDWIRTSR